MVEGIDTVIDGDELALVLTTLDGQEVAERLVHQLIEENLIACGNLIPGVTSLYRWKGRVEKEAEVLVLLKTPAAYIERLFKRVAELHPYDLPELVVLSVEAVSQAYAGWVRQETNEVSE